MLRPLLGAATGPQNQRRPRSRWPADARRCCGFDVRREGNPGPPVLRDVRAPATPRTLRRVSDQKDRTYTQPWTADEFAEWLFDRGHLTAASAVDARRLALRYMEDLHSQGRLPDDWRQYAHSRSPGHRVMRAGALA